MADTAARLQKRRTAKALKRKAIRAELKKAERLAPRPGDDDRYYRITAEQLAAAKSDPRLTAEHVRVLQTIYDLGGTVVETAEDRAELGAIGLKPTAAHLART